MPRRTPSTTTPARSGRTRTAARPTTSCPTLKRPTQIEGYSVVGYEPWCHDAPRAWVLEGSSDGSSWTTLDTQQGVPQDCSAANRRTIAPATYRMYRIHITAGGAADGVEDAVASVAEFELFGEC